MTERPTIKTVGESGQISLGKRYAGQHFIMQRRDDGAILLVAIEAVPKGHWTAQEPARSKITAGLAWAAENPPRESDLAEVERLAGRKRAARRSGGR